MPFWGWSKTASNNATSDPTAPFPEGMSPSAVNDGVRAIMARLAEYRDDISGAINSGGTASAYLATSTEGFTSVADGTMISFYAGATNLPNPTLSLDGNTAYPIVQNYGAPGPAIPAGTIIGGGVYSFRFCSAGATSAWVLRSFMGQPYSIPIGMMMPYLSTTPPNSSFVMPYGQAISRTVYSTLFGLVGTLFGVGDGSTTFNIPDLRGRGLIGLDNMGGVASGRVGAEIAGTTIGATGGTETMTIAQNQLPNIAPAFTGQPSGLSLQVPQGTASVRNDVAQVGVVPNSQYQNATVTPLGSVASINGNVAQQTTNNLAPSIIVPWMLRVI
jgi:microcystin-dependent protein